MNVNNGQRVTVSLQGYEGHAGLVEQEEKDVLSFAAGLRLVHAEVGSTILVDGRPRIVRSMSSSPFTKGFKVVELDKQA